MDLFWEVAEKRLFDKKFSNVVNSYYTLAMEAHRAKKTLKYQEGNIPVNYVKHEEPGKKEVLLVNSLIYSRAKQK